MALDRWTLDIDQEGTCWLVTPDDRYIGPGGLIIMASLCLDLNRYGPQLPVADPEVPPAT